MNQDLSKPEPKDIRIVNKGGVGYLTKVFVDGEEMDVSRVSRITIEIPADGPVEVTYHYLVIKDDSFTFTQHGSIEDEDERS